MSPEAMSDAVNLCSTLPRRPSASIAASFSVYLPGSRTIAPEYSAPRVRSDAVVTTRPF